MGGFGSGLKNGKPVVEHALAISLPMLFRRRKLVAGRQTEGVISWKTWPSNEPVGSIVFGARLEADQGMLVLGYLVRGSDVVTAVRLMTTPQPFGGRRWWFICPRMGGRALTLLLPPEGDTFASRGFHGLRYRSQRENTRDRALTRTHRLKAKLDPDVEWMGPLPERPKWMRQVTYGRHVDRIEAAQARSDDAFARIAKRWLEWA